MTRALVPLLLVSALSTSLLAQETDPPPPPASALPDATPRLEKRGWFTRLNPFASDPLPEYKDAQLRGLILTLQFGPQPIKLSETRQMQVNITLTNKAKRPITLEFPSAQRFEIYLRNSAGKILTTWSDNHAFAQEATTILINPQEHIDYAETIATRELSPNKVFVAEVFFPKYPELRVQQKFLTAP
jgi:hypothetical protein